MNWRRRRGIRSKHELTLALDDFAWQAIEQQAREFGVSDEELATFALMYYLADVDSGRIARRVPPSAGSAAAW